MAVSAKHSNALIWLLAAGVGFYMLSKSSAAGTTAGQGGQQGTPGGGTPGGQGTPGGAGQGYNPVNYTPNGTTPGYGTPGYGTPGGYQNANYTTPGTQGGTPGFGAISQLI